MVSIKTIYSRAFAVLRKKPFLLWGISLLAMLLSALSVPLLGVIPAASIAVSMLLQTAMTLIYLRGYRGEEIAVTQLFDTFKDWKTVKRVLCGMGWASLWIFLWSLIPVVGIVFGIIRTYEYRLTPYILMHDPDVPIKLDTAEDTRFYHCNIKTLNLLPSVVAAQHAKRIGVQETVFHRGDIVTECAHSNVSILKDGVFYSHPNDEFILRGIAKTHMIQACYRLGITVMEKCFTLDDLKNADEIIVTSSSNFCLHACEVDGQPAGGKDPAMLKAIQDEVLREYFIYTGKTTVVD